MSLDESTAATDCWVIERLGPDDSKQILSLENESAPDQKIYERYDEEALSAIFSQPNEAGALGIFENERLIAWGSYRKATGESGLYEISAVLVARDRRRRHLGSRILDALLAELRAHQTCQRIYLTVSPLNEQAVQIYVKKGFSSRALQPDLYGPGADRVTMFLPIEAP
jgi:ribosomal protein S18 acetylase RimI-like enzyme